MIFEKQFNHRIVRNVIVAFGTIFNDISVERYNTDGTINKSIKLPIKYGPKRKWIAKLRQDARLTDEERLQFSLPSMGFSISNLQYDSTRQLIPTAKRRINYSDTQRKWAYSPVPYNLTISLYIMSDNHEDMTQIAEQILPFFTPELTVAIKTVPELNVVDEIPISFNGVEMVDEAEGPFDKLETIMWTLNFGVKLNFYGPVNAQGIIRKVIANLINVGGAGPITTNDLTKPITETITVEPDPIDAEPADDYGYSVTITRNE